MDYTQLQNTIRGFAANPTAVRYSQVPTEFITSLAAVIGPLDTINSGGPQNGGKQPITQKEVDAFNKKKAEEVAKNQETATADYWMQKDGISSDKEAGRSDGGVLSQIMSMFSN